MLPVTAQVLGLFHCCCQMALAAPPRSIPVRAPLSPESLSADYRYICCVDGCSALGQVGWVVMDRLYHAAAPRVFVSHVPRKFCRNSLGLQSQQTCEMYALWRCTWWLRLNGLMHCIIFSDNAAAIWTVIKSRVALRPVARRVLAHRAIRDAEWTQSLFDFIPGNVNPTDAPSQWHCTAVQ